LVINNQVISKTTKKIEGNFKVWKILRSNFLNFLTLVTEAFS